MAEVEDHDKGWQNIQLNIRQMKDRRIKIGLWGDGGGDDVSVVDYGLFNELGTRFIPARPFMSTTADQYRDYVFAFAEDLAGQLIDGKTTPDRIIAVLGEHYRSLVQRVIRSATEWAVENAPSTIRRKGSSSPLIDTGRLVNAIQWEEMR